MQNSELTRILFCLERKGSESYPSLDKAVLFFEVPDLSAVMDAIGKDRIVHSDANSSGRPAWAVIHDPEGHNILLLEGSKGVRLVANGYV